MIKVRYDLVFLFNVSLELLTFTYLVVALVRYVLLCFEFLIWVRFGRGGHEVGKEAERISKFDEVYISYLTELSLV